MRLLTIVINKIPLHLSEKDLKISIVGGLIYIILLTMVVIFFRNPIVHLFGVQQEIILPISLLLLLGLYGGIRVWLDTYTIAVQARNLMRIFIVITPIQAIIAIILIWLLAKYGLMGIMIALISSFAILPAWALPYYHSRHSRNLDVSA